MWYEIFKFELSYRLKRPETYVFFVFLLLFSVFGIDFVFQGAELGLTKRNAPFVVAKTMGAISGIFMILTSMIMGVPILRDFQYNMEALLFVNPLKKQDYLLGRFLGSFAVLLFIFTGLPLGMMLGEFMPWHDPATMLAFNAVAYLQSFVVIVLPTLFFGASLFFVTGSLSRKLLVVYTQGVVLFVGFLLTKAIKNEYWQAMLDPFSLTTLTQYTKAWTLDERNSLVVSFSEVLLHNKLLWFGLGLLILWLGYRKFSFKLLAKSPKRKLKKLTQNALPTKTPNLKIPQLRIQQNLRSKWIQLLRLSRFYFVSLIKETSFWAIVICGIIIIVINSVSLGTVHGVDSYPATYFIVEELQEMSMYFFVIILVFYSGELFFKERDNKLNFIHDSTPISELITLGSKFLAMQGVYILLMLTLILTGALFQLTKGYYQLDLGVYFFGFFVEILPFLALYTIAALFFQAVSNRKFVGIFLLIIFFLANVASEFFGFRHGLYKFGGSPLGLYSDMNGYGAALGPFLWYKGYWLVFGLLLLAFSSLIAVRGANTSLFRRLQSARSRLNKSKFKFIMVSLAIFIALGSYIYYNTNLLNQYWTTDQQTAYRINYEKSLKQFEYAPQPKITAIDLQLELYPDSRSYTLSGSYVLKNKTDSDIDQIHLQKKIADHLFLEDVEFSTATNLDERFKEFDYGIYKLTNSLKPGDSLVLSFTQRYTPLGFAEGEPTRDVRGNGTFLSNEEFPSLGYNRKYEIRDPRQREARGLAPRADKPAINDAHELVNSRSGSDSDGIEFEITIGTKKGQTAVAPGALLSRSTKDNRSYFHYKMNQTMINFYAIVSGKYELVKEQWKPESYPVSDAVDLEIYYHKGHDYNLNRMLGGMKQSLAYYSKNFSPYQYKQLRIMEFPRYSQFAQSFPNTIPFSESIGFVLDIDDQTDVDMAFFVTAHEVAHQWFGMQIEAANVQGRNLILETLSQYAAVMVLKDRYPQQKVDQFLEFQKETYDKNSKRADTAEPSLALVQNQDYVYYNKGALAMYELQKQIGEDKVNLALKRFLEDWNTATGKLKLGSSRYATSKDLLKYLRGVTPVAKQQLITQLFEQANGFDYDQIYKVEN